MPKESAKKFLLLKHINSYPGVFKIEKDWLFCNVCVCKINSQKKFNIEQHINTNKHKQAASRQEHGQQKLITEFPVTNCVSTFNEDLCKFLLETNIPIKKVSHTSFKNIFLKYANLTLPSESSLRNKYVPQLYKETLEKMREIAEGKYIWISVDETTDSEQRLVANFIFGVMDESNDKKSYLLNMGILQNVNGASIAAFCNDSLQLLWPDGIQYEKVLLIVTDSAAYMLSGISSLKIMYPKMLHLTCFAHGLHRVAEFIRSEFESVNYLISCTKAVFLKAPRRKQLFINMNPNLPLPPFPCPTRWGTWLEAAMYYAEHFDAVKGVILKLNSEDSESIKRAKKIYDEQILSAQLAFIKTNFSIIVYSLKKLQTFGLDIQKSKDILTNVKESLDKLKDKKFIHKFDAVFKRNPGYQTFLAINSVLETGLESNNEYVRNLSSSELLKFKFAPSTSVDVERSFSMYNSLLTERRRKLSFQNIKAHMIVYCNCFQINVDNLD